MGFFYVYHEGSRSFNVKVSPSLAVNYPAHLADGYAVPCGQLALRPTRARLYLFDNINDFTLGELGCNAPFAVLHCSVLSHIHLVFSMRGPAEIVFSVVGWVSVIMCDVRKIVWIFDKSHGYKTMNKPPMRLAAAWPPKHDVHVSQLICEWLHNPALWSVVAPSVSWLAQAFYLTFLVNLVFRELFYG